MNPAAIAQPSGLQPGNSTNPSPMKSSNYISILMLLIAGCVSIKPSDVGRGTLDVGRGGKDGSADTLFVTRHASPVTKYVPPLSSHLFKATLDIKKHHLTGLLVIKRMDSLTPPPAPPQTGRGDCPGIYRVVFMNEVGMTFFDLELQPDSLKVVSCFESLNKKTLMKIFETDFRMLISSGSLSDQKIYRQESTNNLIIKGEAGKYKTWQTWSPSGDTLWVTAAKSTMADPVTITYEKYKDGSPLKITIENPFIGMKLMLKKLMQ
jgi:hypothetical protein